MSLNWKKLKFKYILSCILLTFIITCLISIAPINVDDCKCKLIDPNLEDKLDNGVTDFLKSVKIPDHKLAILVPFRDRFEELLLFVPHMQNFLSKQNINYHIFILNQVDRYRFNRASLINVGFHKVKDNYDYIAMHDVDLLPMNDELLYSFPKDGPYHLSSPELHPRYHYPTFVGGILLIKTEHFQQVNGMSNKYWGWGLEDDEFYVRLKEAGLSIKRPNNISTGIHNTFKHNHDRHHRKRDTIKCFNQREVTRKRDRQTGLNNVSYRIVDIIEMKIAETPITVLNIFLMCDKSSTPWCECEKLDGIQEGKT
ncbi:beta-1,4-galactosyltransferase 7 [Prorops nasuta]|uniref:beta-1,4-galactosyltransferase 7 n=1 Tax=Prorops nasuta TaxID=863751 RepID=UPI0034CD3311